MAFHTKSAMLALLCASSSFVATLAAPLSGPTPWSREYIGKHIEMSVNKNLRALARRSEGLALASNFPDPCIYNVGGTWYAFGTGITGVNIQMASSTDFEHWSLILGDAMPTVPAWVNGTAANTWAPDLQQVDDGSFVMYYSATPNADYSKHCIGAATAKTITGPYTGTSTALFCPLTQGGAIDASSFVDTGGQRYVLYKIDGNTLGHGGDCGNDISPTVPTPIMLQAVEGDGITTQGNAVQILDNDGLNDQGIVEAPSLVKAGDGIYYLFFSSGCFSDTNYDVDYATATSVAGPYTRAKSPLFSTGTDGLTSPGGADIWNDGIHMVFHAGSASDREMYTAVVKVGQGSVSA